MIIGVRKNGQSWKDAQQDGWIPGTNLFEVDEAISKGTIIMNLLSDAAQSETWPAIKPQLTKGKVSIHKYSSSILGFLTSPRLFTSPTVSLQSSKTKPKLTFLPKSMSSLSRLKVPAVPFAHFSVRDVASTLPLLSTKILLARQRRRLWLWAWLLAVDTSTRPLLRRRSTPTYTVNEAA